MKVQCLKCKSKLTVPDDKTSNPKLKLRCPGCGLVFPVGKAPRVKDVAAPTRDQRAAVAAAATAAPAAAASAPEASPVTTVPGTPGPDPSQRTGARSIA